tara:strand:- start:239 stop:664 length:426 start_codon:yes stop_codon:yes gene_type:complete
MKKILIVNSNYYKNISDNLIKSAKNHFAKKKVSISLINVPGVFEIPFTIKKYIKNFDAFIALGCVIKGQTPHFELICKSSFDMILKLSVDYKKPIGNGIITALNLKQAMARSGKIKSNKPNKGSEAAKAVLFLLYNGPKKI